MNSINFFEKKIFKINNLFPKNKFKLNNIVKNVKTLNTIGLDGDYIEAEAFGYMAVRRLYDLPITFPGTTGISSPSTGGVISTP